jgi:DNA-binding NarL/FixJ family response regulator
LALKPRPDQPIEAKVESDRTPENEPPAPIRIMIADDDDFVGAALVELIRATPGLSFAGFAFDAPSAIELADREQPDIAIVDVRMPGGGGVSATIGIRATSPRTRVIAFSGDHEELTEQAMRSAGAVDFVLKGTSIELIVDRLVAASASAV